MWIPHGDVDARVHALAIGSDEAGGERRRRSGIGENEGIAFEENPHALSGQTGRDHGFHRRRRPSRLRVGVRDCFAPGDASQIRSDVLGARITNEGFLEAHERVAQAERRGFQALHSRVAEPRKIAHAVHGPGNDVSRPSARRAMGAYEIASNQRFLTFARQKDESPVRDDVNHAGG
jgi:hypothetical protein